MGGLAIGRAVMMAGMMLAPAAHAQSRSADAMPAEDQADVVVNGLRDANASCLLYTSPSPRD